MKSKKNFIIFFLIYCIIFTIIGAVSGCKKGTVYVDADNKDPHPNGTQENPYPTIQEGIDAVMEGGKVIIFSGTYIENITINKSVILQGLPVNDEGIPEVVAKSLDKAVITISSAADVEIVNLEVTGDLETGSIYINTVGDINIEGNYITGNIYIDAYVEVDMSNNSINGSIYVEGAGEIDISTNIVDGSIYVEGAVEIDISGNIIENMSGSGIVIVNSPPISGITSTSTTNSINNNTVQNCSGSGMTISGSAVNVTKNMVIANGPIGFKEFGAGVGYGIEILDNSNVTLTGNLIKENLNYGLNIRNSIAKIGGTEEGTANSIISNKKGGIQALGAYNLSIIGNLITDNYGKGIYLYNSKADIIKNSIIGTKKDPSSSDDIGDGINAYTNSILTIKGNNIKGNYRAGIILTNSLASIGGKQGEEGNVISGNKDGVVLYQCLQDITIQGNNIESNLRYGIVSNQSKGLVGGENSTLGNVISTNLQGIYITGNSGLTIQGNTISNHLGQGVYIRNNGLLSTVKIIGNKISENVGAGIYTDGSKVEILNNTKINSTKLSSENIGDGIYVLNGSEAIISGNTIKGNSRCGASIIASKAIIGKETADDKTPSSYVGNDFLENKIGIHSTKNSILSIIGNNINNQLGFGISIKDNGLSYVVDVIKNTILYNTVAGIYIYNSKANISENPQISNTKQRQNSSTCAAAADGVIVREKSDVTLFKNTIAGNTRFGVIYDKSNGSITENNVIDNAQLYSNIQIVVQGTQGGYSVNKSNNNIGSGIDDSSTTSKYCTSDPDVE